MKSLLVLLPVLSLAGVGLVDTGVPTDRLEASVTTDVLNAVDDVRYVAPLAAVTHVRLAMPVCTIQDIRGSYLNVAVSTAATVPAEQVGVDITVLRAIDVG